MASNFYLLLILIMLDCSVNCYNDKELVKNEYQKNAEYTFEDLTRYDDSKSNENGINFEDLIKYGVIKRDYDSIMYQDSDRRNKVSEQYKYGNSEGYNVPKNQKYFKPENYTGKEEKDFERENYFDEDYGFIGNPDVFGKIERPCRVFDLNCIQRFFAEHSKCKITRGPLPEYVHRPQLTHYIPLANLSATLNNVRIGGFRNTRIEEFYIDKVTKKMVFSINIRNLNANIPTTYFQFYRNGREPIVTVTEDINDFASITFTAVIPINEDGIQLEKAEVTSFPDTLPVFVLGPEIASSPDPVVIAGITQLFADLPTVTQEFLLADSPYYPPAYIQLNICDFGLRVQ